MTTLAKTRLTIARGSLPPASLNHRASIAETDFGLRPPLAVAVPLVAVAAVDQGEELEERQGLVPGVAPPAALVIGLGSQQFRNSTNRPTPLSAPVRFLVRAPWHRRWSATRRPAQRAARGRRRRCADHHGRTRSRSRQELLTKSDGRPTRMVQIARC